jgi:hypothetical protein
LGKIKDSRTINQYQYPSTNSGIKIKTIDQ